MRAGLSILLCGCLALVTTSASPSTTGASINSAVRPGGIARQALAPWAYVRGYGAASPAPSPPRTSAPPHRTTPVWLAVQAPAPPGVGAGEAVASALRPVSRLNTRAPFRMRVSAWTPPLSGGRSAGSVWVVGELDGQTRKELEWNLGARGELTLLAPDGSQVSSRFVELPAGEVAFGVRIPETGDLPPGDYSASVRLQAIAEEGRFLSDAVPFSVLSRPSLLGEALLWRRGPSTGLRHVLTADPRFRRNERLRLELPSASTAPAVARLLDRMGKALQVPPNISTRADASGQLRWIVVDAPLAPLAPGDYALEVTQEGSSQMAGFRVVP